MIKDTQGSPMRCIANYYFPSAIEYLLPRGVDNGDILRSPMSPFAVFASLPHIT